MMDRPSNRIAELDKADRWLKVKPTEVGPTIIKGPRFPFNFFLVLGRFLRLKKRQIFWR